MIGPLSSLLFTTRDTVGTLRISNVSTSRARRREARGKINAAGETKCTRKYGRGICLLNREFPHHGDFAVRWTMGLRYKTRDVDRTRFTREIFDRWEGISKSILIQSRYRNVEYLPPDSLPLAPSSVSSRKLNYQNAKGEAARDVNSMCRAAHTGNYESIVSTLSIVSRVRENSVIGTLAVSRKSSDGFWRTMEKERCEPMENRKVRGMSSVKYSCAEKNCDAKL